MAKIYYDQDADLDLLNGKKIAIVGYGSQGHAHALNLQDSGMDVRVGLYEGSKSWPEAEAAGLNVKTTADACAEADIIMILAPDTKQPAIYRESVAPHLAPGKTLMFGHGFNIRYGQIIPPEYVDVSMIAPKSPGHRVREVFVDGVGTPGLLWGNLFGKKRGPRSHVFKYALSYGPVRELTHSSGQRQETIRVFSCKFSLHEALLKSLSLPHISPEFSIVLQS